MSAAVVSLGNASLQNVRRAQILEHIARNLDDAIADGATELSLVGVVYGHKDEAISFCTMWNCAENTGVSQRMIVSDAGLLLASEAHEMARKARQP